MLLCAAWNADAQVFWTETFSNSCAQDVTQIHM
jgi:hypothetical protein